MHLLGQLSLQAAWYVFIKQDKVKTEWEQWLRDITETRLASDQRCGRETSWPSTERTYCTYQWDRCSLVTPNVERVKWVRTIDILPIEWRSRRMAWETGYYGAVCGEHGAGTQWVRTLTSCCCIRIYVYMWIEFGQLGKMYIHIYL